MRRRRRVGDGRRFPGYAGCIGCGGGSGGGGECSIGLGGGGAAGSNAASALSMYPHSFVGFAGCDPSGRENFSGSGTYTAAGLEAAVTVTPHASNDCSSSPLPGSLTSQTVSAMRPLHFEVDVKDSSSMSSQTTYRSGVPATIFAPTTGFVTEMVSMVTAAPPLRTEDHARTAYEPGIGAGATEEAEVGACSSSAASCPNRSASRT